MGNNKMHSMKARFNAMVALAIGAALVGTAGLGLVTPAWAQPPSPQSQDSRVNTQDSQDTGRIKQNATQTKDSKDKDKDKEPKHTVSKALGKPLKAAQDAMTAKKYPEAIAKLKEAEAMSGKSPWDEHLINEMYGYTYAHTGDFPNAAKAYEATLSDGFVDQADIPGRVRLLAQMYYQLKNYEKAIDFGTRAIKGGFDNDEIQTIVGQSYYLKNDYKGTIKFVDTWIDGTLKKGQTPKEQTINLVLSSCVKLEDAECTSKSLEKMVTYYPKPEYWGNLVLTLFQAPSMNDKTLLNTFRLANEVDVLKKPEDFTEMAQLAIEQGSPGEAQHVLEKAFQRNIFPDARTQDKNKRLLASAQKAAEQDLAQLPKNATDAETAPTGDKSVGVGLAYLGYQQYDKASDALSKGLSKGGLKNEAEAHLLLGIAQLKGGHKDEAVKSFKAVKGDANLERIASLWSLHAKQA